MLVQAATLGKTLNIQIFSVAVEVRLSKFAWHDCLLSFTGTKEKDQLGGFHSEFALQTPAHPTGVVYGKVHWKSTL